MITFLVWMFFNLLAVNCLAIEESLKAAPASAPAKFKAIDLKMALQYGEYYGYDYDYGYYATSYRCDPRDYDCNNYGYDFGGYHRRK